MPLLLLHGSPQEGVVAGSLLPSTMLLVLGCQRGAMMRHRALQCCLLRQHR